MTKKEDISLIIADDHPMLLKGLYKELSANKYNVIAQATDGMKALELILKLQPEIAFLDIDMPLLTGFEVVKMAKEKRHFYKVYHVILPQGIRLCHQGKNITT